MLIIFCFVFGFNNFLISDKVLFLKFMILISFDCILLFECGVDRRLISDLKVVGMCLWYYIISYGRGCLVMVGYIGVNDWLN